MNTTIIQFAKSPDVGKVKTRMMPVLSAVEACDLHKNLVRITASFLARIPQVNFELWASARGDFIDMIGETHGASVFVQQGRDLGERLAFASSQCLTRSSAIIIVGSDSPYFTEAYFSQALNMLNRDNIDVVLGPAGDGGYVLIGIKKDCPALFESIDWGSERVFTQTVNNIKKSALTVSYLPVLDDVDRPADLAKLMELIPDILQNNRT